MAAAPTDDASHPGDPGCEDNRDTTARPLVVYSRPAMACTFEFYFSVAPDVAVAEPAMRALDLVEAIEAELTVYRDTSRVSALNREAWLRPTALDHELFSLLELAARVGTETRFAFDITSGPLCRLWHTARRERRLPDEAEIRHAMLQSRPGHLSLDAESSSLTLATEQSEIQLNSIGKGYALDRAADVLRESELETFLLHGGNSSVFAAAVPGEDPPWCIGIRHPRRPELRIAELLVHNGGVGTSGSGTQFFHHRGRRYGHIIDPRTGMPSDGVYSATVIAATAAESDALATAFYVMGPEQVRAYSAAHPEIAAVVVCPGETADAVAIHTYNLAATECRILSDSMADHGSQRGSSK